MFHLFSITRRYTKVALYIAAVAFLLPAHGNTQDLSAATQKLFDAVHNGDLAQVQISIAGGGNIDAVNAWGVTPVDLAVDKGHFDIVHFLLQVRDLKSNTVKKAPKPAPATVTAVGAPPIAPAPAAAVAEVYSPPPGSGAWSATVVTAEPPPPPAPDLPAGPSPFDTKAPATTAPLAIIGTVRGPNSDGKIIDTSVQIAVEEAFQEVVKKPAAPVEPVPVRAPEKTVAKPVTKPVTKPVAKPVLETAAIKPVEEKQEAFTDQDSGVWSNIKNFLNLDSDQPVVATPQPDPQPAKAPTLKTAEIPRPVAKPTVPVSPPNVKGPPPPIEGKVMPQRVTAAPMTSMPEEDLLKTQVVPVRPKAPKDEKPVFKVTRITKEDKQTPKQLATAPPPREPVQVGTTTLPGAPREQKGFFSNVMSVFSPDEENKDSEDTKQADPAQNGDWSVKQIQQAKVVPKKPSVKPKRKLPKNHLKGVILSLGRTTALDKAPPPQTPAPWFYKSCIDKKRGSIIFCIESLDWPDEINNHFMTDSVMYEGVRTIVRYDEGAAAYYHTLFRSESYTAIVNFFTRRYGPPTKKLKRSIAPLAKQRRLNPTVIWQSIAPVTNLLTTLEVRKYDDNRGGFPDTSRGAVYLYHEWSQPVFPYLSSVELMLLRAEKKQR